MAWRDSSDDDDQWDWEEDLSDDLSEKYHTDGEEHSEEDDSSEAEEDLVSAIHEFLLARKRSRKCATPTKPTSREEWSEESDPRGPGPSTD